MRGLAPTARERRGTIPHRLARMTYSPLTSLPVLHRSILPTLLALLAVLCSVGEATASAAQATAERAPRRDRVAVCSWDRPGHNPFMGDVVAAVDRYSDIPTPVRVRLKERMQARQYDEMVDIRRDSIRGRADYQPTIRDMHFGVDRVCAQVSRSGWTSQMHERGLVYCEAGHCILVPTVCRNVSRIERTPAAIAGAPAGDAPVDGGAPSPALRPTDASSERYAGEPDAAPGTARPQTTSSFAEAVAGAALALFPLGDGAGELEPEPGLGGTFGVPLAGLPMGGAGGAGGATGTGGSGAGAGGGAGAPVGDGGRNGFLSQTPFGGGPGSFEGAVLPEAALPGAITPVPEPATWATLLLGLGLVWRVSARRAARHSAALAR